jgi:hypothetical protein
MEKKLIELTKNDEGKCLLCCERDGTVKFSIKRDKYDDTIVSMNVCSRCLAKMQNDIQKICE